MRTVITYGTFDLFHRGHYNILKRAKEEGDYLIVGVSGETYDAERGKLSVQDSLATRIEKVKETGFADKIIVEEYLGQKISDIQKYHVDVLVIGSDWMGKFDHLRKYCEVKYLDRTKDISSTQLREEKLKIYRLGIVTDNVDDNHAIRECEAVSGIHVESVFAEKPEIASAFRDKYILQGSFSDFDSFLNTVDIVLIKTPFGNRSRYVEMAVNAGKHVICDMPFTLDEEKSSAIRKKAEEKGVVLMENLAMLHLHAFGQLQWMARGNLIGDLVSIKCSISKDMFDNGAHIQYDDLAYYVICAITKIFGIQYTDLFSNTVKNEDGEIIYGMIGLGYNNMAAQAEICMDVDCKGGMEIIGTNGKIIVPDAWWNVGFFEMKQHNEKRAKRYSFNLDGNGLRYLVQAMLRELRLVGGYDIRITPEESVAVLEILNKMKK